MEAQYKINNNQIITSKGGNFSISHLYCIVTGTVKWHSYCETHWVTYHVVRA